MPLFGIQKATSNVRVGNHRVLKVIRSESEIPQHSGFRVLREGISLELSSVCSVACAFLDMLSCIYSVNYSFTEGIVL